jgi:cation:H+ antiporter
VAPSCERGLRPASVLLFVCYGFGLHLLTQVEDRPMWSPVETQHTQDKPEQAQAAGRDERATGPLWWVFLVYAAITAVAGYVVGEAASAPVELTELSHSTEGTVFAAVAKLPELVTAIAAVRIGAVNLAVGDVIEGNSFEVLFLAAADFFYRPGSIYHEFSTARVRSITSSTWTTCSSPCSAILMTGVLLLGMLRCQHHGMAGIGFESALVLLLYLGSVVLLFA